jgi:thermitase
MPPIVKTGVNRTPLRLLLVLAAAAVALAVTSQARGAELSVSLEPGGTVADADRVAAALGGRVVDAIPQLRAYLIETPAGSSARVALNALADIPSVRSAQLNRFDEVARTVRDPFRSLQWHLDQLHADEAWDTSFGSEEVLIAIVDTGIDYGHVDLDRKVVLGRDVGDEDDDPRDENGHGTQVAGLAAAVTDNEQGIAGVCPLCLLLAVKANKGGGGQITKFDSAEGIVYAADHGADVINISSGSSTPDPVQQDAVAYALDKGIVMIAAAGNEASDVIQYPAAHEGVVAVAASTDKSRLWVGTSFGPWVDVAAPGFNLLTTSGSAYARVTGTSFAAPLVSGAAGLALTAAAAGRAPAGTADLTPAEIADALVTGTLPLVDTTLRRIDLPRVLRRALGGPIEPDPPLDLDIRPFALSPNAWFVAGYPRATAGERFAAGGRVRRTDTDELLKSGTISCAARVGTTLLRVVQATFAKAIARCVWQIPASAGGKTLRGSLTVRFADGTETRSFSVRVKKP